jgi:hypothetical protein
MSRKVTPAPPPPDEHEEEKRDRLFFLKLFILGAAVNVGGAVLMLHQGRTPRLAGVMVAPEPPLRRIEPRVTKINTERPDYDGEMDINDQDDHNTDDDVKLIDREAEDH